MEEKAFAEDNRYIVDSYNEEKCYIDSVRNDKGKIPINAWQKKYSKLSVQLRELDSEYHDIKNEVAEVDKIRVKVYDVLRNERQRGQPEKSQGVES